MSNMLLTETLCMEACMSSETLGNAAVKEDVCGTQETASTLLKVKAQDESLKLCRATFASGKQAELYN